MKKIFLTLLQFYKASAPLRRWFSPPLCRFYPTCSSYMTQAIDEYGALTGTLLGLRRLAHCHPLHPGGIDPLPTLISHDISLINQEISV